MRDYRGGVGRIKSNLTKLINKEVGGRLVFNQAIEKSEKMLYKTISLATLLFWGKQISIENFYTL